MRRATGASATATWTDLCRFAVTDGVPRRSFVVAVIVGTILNLINQGDGLFTGASLDLVKAALTYLVPYCVSTYGAVSYRIHAERRRR
jgi:hypothetical protein